MLKVLTWNIHKGFGSSGGRLSLSGIRTALHDIDADLILMQEVVGRHDRHAVRHALWPSQSQAQYLAEGHWEHVVYAANAHYAHGHHGNAVLSRFPILSFENIDLSTHRWEHRGLLHAQVQLEGCSSPLHVLCTHLDLFQRGRIKQIARIAARIRQCAPLDAPLLLAGDFNDWGQGVDKILVDDLGLLETHRAMHGRLGRSFPARLPMLMLDRLYVRGLTVHSARLLTGARWHTLSDHAPLVVELDLPVELGP
jgi:endonuclease/exonuclease/phosphatase family metal-dependent hydrolase